MKTRSGFVSNSSSSSFIVAFKNIPHDQEELRYMLFGDEQSRSQYDYTFTTKELAKVVWNDFQEAIKNSPMDKREIANKVGGSAEYNGMPIPPPYYNWKNSENYEAYDRECEQYSRIVATQFLRDNKNATILYFSYGDNSEIGAVLEHGGTFDKLSHIYINQH